MKQYWQVVLWFLMSVVFAYFPFWFQRKLIFGAHIPLCILAAVSFDHMLAKRPTGWSRGLCRAVATAALFRDSGCDPNLILLINETKEVRVTTTLALLHKQRYDERPQALNRRSKPVDIVYASLQTSRFIPAFSGNTVLWSYSAMSVDFDDRLYGFKTYSEISGL